MFIYIDINIGRWLCYQKGTKKSRNIKGSVLHICSVKILFNNMRQIWTAKYYYCRCGEQYLYANNRKGFWVKSHSDSFWDDFFCRSCISLYRSLIREVLVHNILWYISTVITLYVNYNIWEKFLDLLISILVVFNITGSNTINVCIYLHMLQIYQVDALAINIFCYLLLIFFASYENILNIYCVV